MATRSKYEKMPTTNKEEKSTENEIRLSARRKPNPYIIRAAALFLEKKLDYIVLKGLGNTIPTALLVAEVLRRRIKGLHQINTIKNTVVEDKFEPKEEGLDTVILKRTLSLLEIKLCKNVTP